jgi:hypothetical protein
LTPQPLSPQQVQALHVLRAAGSLTTEQFMRQMGERMYTEDQARNLLARLEKRGHVAGDGHGRTRVWSYVSTPELETSLGPPDPPALNGGSPETGVRTYVVLERRALDDLVVEIAEEAGLEVDADLIDALAQADAVFDRIADPVARNTEHALRTAAKDAYEGVPGEFEPSMVAVAERMFQVVSLKVKNSQTVGIG